MYYLFYCFHYHSCNDEPLEGNFGESYNANNPNSAQIIGDWNVVSFDALTATTTVFNAEEIETSSVITGSEFDYVVTFTSNEFTTHGNYKMRAITEVNGVVMDDMSYTDVNGSGNYYTNGNLMSTDGLLFDLEIDGVNTSVFETSQTATYQFSSNGNVLTMSQVDEQIQVVNEIEIVIVTESSTVLERM
ncbi:hypothetical protein DI383_03145 [Flavobacteriaceae bacterium LYZ1037]|nr:hypothetical protein DI383_03145 [Flavobacteriaceae bacterium LYZ1037]